MWKFEHERRRWEALKEEQEREPAYALAIMLMAGLVLLFAFPTHDSTFETVWNLPTVINTTSSSQWMLDHCSSSSSESIAPSCTSNSSHSPCSVIVTAMNVSIACEVKLTFYYTSQVRYQGEQDWATMTCTDSPCLPEARTSTIEIPGQRYILGGVLAFSIVLGVVGLVVFLCRCYCCCPMISRCHPMFRVCDCHEKLVAAQWEEQEEEKDDEQGDDEKKRPTKTKEEEKKEIIGAFLSFLPANRPR